MNQVSKPHSEDPGVHAETIPTRERIAKAHSRLPAEWHGWHAEMANGGAGHFAYHNSREACYICTLLDDLDSIEEQLETLREAVREHVESAHGQYGTDKHAKLRAALSNPASVRDCPRCQGHGRLYGQTSGRRAVADIGCPDCGGTGKVSNQERKP